MRVIIEKLRSWLRSWASRGPSIDMALIRTRFEDALNEEEQLGWQHKADSYYTDPSTGHNVGADELRAVGHARSIHLDATDVEIQNPARYLARLLDDLEEIKCVFRAQESDPDGYGIGTLHSISKKLRESFDGLVQ